MKENKSHNFIFNYWRTKMDKYIPGYYYVIGYDSFNFIHLIKDGIVEYHSENKDVVFFTLKSIGKYWYIFPVNISDIKVDDRIQMKAIRFGKIIKECIKNKTFRIF